MTLLSTLEDTTYPNHKNVPHTTHAHTNIHTYSLSHPHRTKEALERVAYEYVQELKRQNTVYAEIRYNPFSEIEGGPTAKEYCEGVIAGLERGEKDTGVKVRSILCFKRENPGNTALETTLSSSILRSIPTKVTFEEQVFF